MPSPFPGMNPYLEQSDTWEDFHHNFITRARELIEQGIGPNYFAKIVVRPVQLALPAEDRERYSWLEIRDCRERKVVSVLELLSPSNNINGPDRDDYLRKRTLIFEHKIHLVEIDLRRGGVRPWPPELPECDYYALVSRWQDRPRLGMWPIHLRDRLPVIPIPLSPPDSSVALDLQVVLDRVYDDAGYAKYIYADQPDPPLSPEDAAWAQQFVPRRS